MAGRLHRALAQPYHAPVPVLCVGNLVAGGAGKTPVALALVSALLARDVAAHVVTRGYGGRLGGPVRVDPARHDAAAVGDEALLLQRRAPCWVARDRAAGVRAAVEAGARAILLDDGFQNPTVVKTLSLIVVDAAYGFGNGRVIPAGPLRERLGNGLARTDAVVLLAVEGEPVAALPAALTAGRPIVPAVLTPIGGERIARKRVFAFAGIGRPEKFFATARGLGAELTGTRSFSDHHPYSAVEIAELRRAADRNKAQLVTTAKDFVRVPTEARGDIEVLEVEIRWPDPAALAGVIRPVVLVAQGNGGSAPENRR